MACPSSHSTDSADGTWPSQTTHEVMVVERRSAPGGGGWRDLMINLVIVGDERKHVCEIQIVHEMMLTARKALPGHAVYGRVRNAEELLAAAPHDATAADTLASGACTLATAC